MGRATLDEQHKEQLSYDATGPRSRRHVASFAASIAAHAAVVALIVCFASPLARTHSEWVLAYLVEGAGGASGRVGASAAAPGAPPIHAARVAPALLPSAPPRAARKAHRRRVEDADSEVARLAPNRPVAPARPGDSERPEDSQPRRRATRLRSDRGRRRRRVGAATSGGRAGAGVGAAAGGGAGDSDSMAHADYASNPPPAYPDAARRREQQGTVLSGCWSAPTAPSSAPKLRILPGSTRSTRPRWRRSGRDGASCRRGTADLRSKAGYWCRYDSL